jgi:hypothetical protein
MVVRFDRNLLLLEILGWEQSIRLQQSDFQGLDELYRENLSVLENLRAELIEVLKDPYEAPVIVYFNMIDWLDSQIQKPPCRDCKRKGYQGVDV